MDGPGGLYSVLLSTFHGPRQRNCGAGKATYTEWGKAAQLGHDLWTTDSSLDDSSGLEN